MSASIPTLLSSAVTSFFAEGGGLAHARPQYQPRPVQQTMASAVAEAIEKRDCLVVEAGTGVGKTYAYLVPCLLSGQRVLVSTATKALQDQLYTRDIPGVVEALGLPVRVALLKGRSSYLCRQRLDEAWQRVPGGDRYAAEQLRRVEVWATCTSTGDMAELSGLDERSGVWPLITSTRDNCLGSACPQAKSCHVNLARTQALAADVVVVNHYLFMADWTVRETGVAELLPSVDVLVFDEAHQLPDVCVQFLGTTVSAGQWRDWARDVHQTGRRLAKGWANWDVLAEDVVNAVQKVGAELPVKSGDDQTERRIAWTAEAPDGVSPSLWCVAVEALQQSLLAACESLAACTESAPELSRLEERGHKLLHDLELVARGSEQNDSVRWVSPGVSFRLNLTPLSVAERFRPAVMPEQPSGRKSWVFTSATLGTDPGLTWFTQAMGLQGANVLQLGSPFDYKNQAAVWVPPSLPDPSDRGHATQLCETIWPWILKLGGRTLILTTTLRVLEVLGRHLVALSDRDLGPEVLVQGQSPKRELLDRFRRAANGGESGAVLVASASFWEGVDVPGDDLQMVVIDKLPFPPPDDPWVAARTTALEARGERAFKAYFLPEAALALKQGAGRLIRSELDRGLLVIGDRRLVTKSYGKPLRSALPPMRWLTSEEEVQDWLGELVTTASTRDLPWT